MQGGSWQITTSAIGGNTPPLRHPRAEQAEGRRADPGIDAVTERQCECGAGQAAHATGQLDPRPVGRVRHRAPLIHIAGRGFWFGLFPITNGHPRIISVTARTSCVVATIPQTALQSLLHQDAELWRWLNLLSLEGAALAVQALVHWQQ
jgi:CRP-like cAMP-binding protein